MQNNQTPLNLRKKEIPYASDIVIGRRVHFIPASFYHGLTAAPGNGGPIFQSVEGVICYIHWRHRYFTVTYEMSGHRFLESFKF